MHDSGDPLAVQLSRHAEWRCSCLRLSALLVITAASLVAADSPAKKDTANSSSSARVSDKGVFRAICGSCHPVGLINDFRAESEWRATVDQMVAIGAKCSWQTWTQ